MGHRGHCHDSSLWCQVNPSVVLGLLIYFSFPFQPISHSHPCICFTVRNEGGYSPLVYQMNPPQLLHSQCKGVSVERDSIWIKKGLKD